MRTLTDGLVTAKRSEAWRRPYLRNSRARCPCYGAGRATGARVSRIYPDDANDFLTVDYDYRGPSVIERSVQLETDPNVSVDWIIERDGLLRMTGSMNWRNDTGDANYTCLLAGFEYGRGDMGIPTSETFRRADFPNDPLTRDFFYDTLHRLTDVDYPNEPNEEFYYDLAGNLTKYYGRDGSDPNFFANTANQYTRVEGLGDEPNGFAYDAAGKMTGDSRGYSFTYDHDNHLTQVTKGGSGQRSFYYDALGRRVGMMDYTEMPWPVELYIYSGQNVVEVRDASLDRQRYFIHGPTYIDERVQMVTTPPVRRTTPGRTALWTFERVDTLRNTLLHRAGRLTRPQGTLTLTLNANAWLRERLAGLLHTLQTLRPAA